MKLALLFISLLFNIHADTISNIKQRGVLNCGVSTGLPGFSSLSDKGEWHGFDVDICRAIAVSIFDDSRKVKFVPLTNQMKFNALQNQKIDVLSRVTSFNYSNDQKNGLIFAGVTYFDSQGVMVYKQPNVKTLKDLNGLTVCLISGTTSERNLVRYSNKYNISFETISYETGSFALKALKKGRCEALSTDKSALYILKKSLAHPDEANILEESIGFEPLALMIRDDDPEWFKHIRWVIFSLIKAEIEGVGISDATAPYKFKTNIPKKYQAILSKVGNYQDIFNRNLGEVYDIPRALNDLYQKGGLLYAPDFT